MMASGMLPKWTPGPWQLGERNRSYVFIDSKPDRRGIPDWRQLARVAVKSGGEPNPEGEANARLIAAAPELYKALVAVSDLLFGRPDMTARLMPMMGPAENAVFAAAADALHKARGEP